MSWSFFTKRRLRKAPPVKIGTLVAGTDAVRVQGRIVVDDLIEAPSGTRCVLYRTKISRPIPQPGKEGSGPRWAQVAFEAKAAPFWIEDESGRIRVNFSLDVDDMLFGLSDKFCPPAELSIGEQALLATERAPGVGEIALERIAVDDSLRIRERILMPGHIVVAMGCAQRAEDGSLELGADGKRPLVIAEPKID